jgi:hypothetical protein
LAEELMDLSRWRKIAAPALLLITGISMMRAERMTWGAADLVDGTRYKIAPSILSHVLEPHQTVSPTEECGFGAIFQPTVTRCQFGPAAELPMRQLALAATLLLIAGSGAVAAALLVPWWDRRPARVAIPVVLGGLIVLALALFRPAALEFMTLAGGTNGGLGGVGWYSALLAPILTALAMILEWERVAEVRAPKASAVVVPSLAVVLIAALLLTPRALGNSIALLAAMVGVLVGGVLSVAGLAGRISCRRTVSAV